MKEKNINSKDQVDDQQDKLSLNNEKSDAVRGTQHDSGGSQSSGYSDEYDNYSPWG